MTDTAQMNGPTEGTPRFIDTVDPENPAYQRELIRPAEVKEDVKQMENRKRVSLILNSQAFRDELEQIVESQIKTGPHPASLIALQQISDMLLPHVTATKISSMGSGGVSTPIIPINDIRGVDTISYNKGEKLLRCKLASLYRLVDLFGWTETIYNHISVRINQNQEHFLINPFGMLYNEVTASSLVKIDMQGNVIEQGSTTLGVNSAGFTIHSAIHAARPDIRCVIHIHHPPVMAVSMMKQGLLPISQEALICGEITYHSFTGISDGDEERDQIARDLGPNSKVMILRNHGVVACGTTIEEAFLYAHSVVTACDAQIRAIPVGIDNLVLLSDELRDKTHRQALKGVHYGGEGSVRWKFGELQFEALMRHLDNAGFKTGFVYRQPVIRQLVKKEKLNADVEHPPAATSFMYDEQEGGRAPLKEAMEMQKKRNKSDWLNSPNAYQKKEIDEIGTPNPKKIIKWEAAAGDSETTAVRIENPNQFAPQGDNPKELKEKAKYVRKAYYEEKVSAGPQSKILEGATWEEAGKQMPDANTSGTGDKVIIVGAASKGIIQRDQQHNVTVYHAQYSQNPFADIKDDELEKYKHEIEHRYDPNSNPSEEAVQQKPMVNGTPEANGTDTDTMSKESEPQENTIRRTRSKETNIDDIFNDEQPLAVSTPIRKDAVPPESPPVDGNLQRSESARYSPEKRPQLVDELKQNFGRSKSERKPGKRGEKPSSPAKSSSASADTLDDTSTSKEGSPSKNPNSSQPEKKKKKKLRLPSFSKKKKDKKEKEKQAAAEAEL